MDRLGLHADEGAIAGFLTKVATFGCFWCMVQVPLKEAKDKFAELGRRAEAGETIVVTRHGESVFQLVPHSVKKWY